MKQIKSDLAFCLPFCNIVYHMHLYIQELLVFDTYNNVGFSIHVTVGELWSIIQMHIFI